MVHRPLDPASLTALVTPRSVAVVGASSDPAKIGGRPLAFLKKAGFAGSIIAVNPSAATVQGYAAVSTPEALPQGIDCAIIALPRHLVEDAIKGCLARGVRAFVLFSSGFSEAGVEGEGAEARILELVRAAGARMLGPNSLGLFNVSSGFFGTFATALDAAWPVRGKVGIASQSGAFGSYLLALAEKRGLGVTGFIATGNEPDVDVAEAIAWFAADPETEVILAALEGVRDGARFIAALQQAKAAGKPVIVMKTGRSETGRKAVMSHTGSMAGSDEIFDAVFRRHGAWRAQTLEECIDCALSLVHGRRVVGDRAAVITTSGGVGVLLADDLETFGFSLPSLDESAREQIASYLPMASGGNPVDSSTQILADMSLFGRLLRDVADLGNYDILCLFLAHVGRNPDHFIPIKKALAELRQERPNLPILVSTLTDAESIDELAKLSIPVFEDPGRAALAAKALRFFNEQSEVGITAAALAVETSEIGAGELAATELLASFGLPMVVPHLARDATEAVAAVKALGRCVMKIASPDIEHKSDIGGVVLNVSDSTAAQEAYGRITHSAATYMPNARVDGVLVAPMVPGDIEAILGSINDPVFGPVVMFGLGGIMTEAMKDVSLALAPVTFAEAMDMISSLRAAKIFDGFRGRPAVDRKALAEVIVDFSKFAHAHRERIASVEINPLLLSGRSIFGVDALILRKEQE